MDFIQYQALWNTILTFFLLISAVILFQISIKGYKIKNTYGATSTLISAVILLLLSFYNNVYGLFPWPYNGFFTWWAGILLILYVGFWGVMKIKEKGESVNNQKNNFYADKNFYQDEISLKMEYYRKSFHLAGFLIILAFYVVCNLVNNAVIEFINDPNMIERYERLWGSLSLYPYTINDPNAIADLTFFALLGTFAFVCFPEYIRVLVGAKYSLYNYLTKAVLRGKEYKSAGPQIFLIIGATTSFWFAQMGWVSYNIAIAAAVVACFSDALAAVIGRTYGHHKVKTLDKSTKSLEGFIAGTGSAYIISMIFVGPVYAIFVAVIFFLLDYFTLPIADNLLNPILLTLGLMLAIDLLGLPIGW
ncbi:MAG: hypothetical protein GF364_17430 [Candidatus Lokiarchaeota archaeon]|nr:hypothetical protein [Candidatus Lokiarchaeota archaeon]